MGFPGAVITRLVVCSEPLAKTSVKSLKVTVALEVPSSMPAEVASGGELVVSHEGGRRMYTLVLQVADALILRREKIRTVSCSSGTLGHQQKEVLLGG